MLDGTTVNSTATPVTGDTEVSIRLAGWTPTSLGAGSHSLQIGVTCRFGAAANGISYEPGPISVLVLP